MIDQPLWVLPPFQPSVPTIVVLSWLVTAVFVALFWAGIALTIGAWLGWTFVEALGAPGGW